MLKIALFILMNEVLESIPSIYTNYFPQKIVTEMLTFKITQINDNSK